MMYPLRNLIAAAAAFSVLAGVSLHANTVTVTQNDTDPAMLVVVESNTYGPMYAVAGVIELTVDGKDVQALCVDPWHFTDVGNPFSYQTEALSNAPKSALDDSSKPNPMGDATAKAISQLWAQYFTDATTDSTGVVAAALQLKIWQLVTSAVQASNPSASFTVDGVLNDPTNLVQGEIDAMTTFLNKNPKAPEAALIALTGAGQDYVIPGTIPTAPETSTTVLLFGLSLTGLVAMRKKLQVR